MKLRDMKIQEAKGSFFVYLPKIWVSEIGLKKGDSVTCSVEEGDLSTLHLKKEEVKGDVRKV